MFVTSDISFVSSCRADRILIIIAEKLQFVMLCTFIRFAQYIWFAKCDINARLLKEREKERKREKERNREKERKREKYREKK